MRPVPRSSNFILSYVYMIMSPRIDWPVVGTSILFDFQKFAKNRQNSPDFWDFLTGKRRKMSRKPQKSAIFYELSAPKTKTPPDGQAVFRTIHNPYRAYLINLMLFFQLCHIFLCDYVLYIGRERTACAPT